MKRRVIVGLSGGVDSGAAAYLLKAAGFEVIGLTIRTQPGVESRCCAIGEARRMAAEMGIDYYVCNAARDFRQRVVQPFIEAYLLGRTPNPCVACNPWVKWAQLMEAAQRMGADYVATGHYAETVRLENGRCAIRRAASDGKDQSYMLYGLSQTQLAHTLLPLGRLEKSQVRALAARAGLSAAQRPDSQEICFVTGGNYADFIEETTETALPPPGNFVDTRGHILGRHQGIHHYTPGQRRGLGLALGHPVYVKAIDREKNQVILGGEASLYQRTILCDHLRFMALADLPPGGRMQALVKIRYHHAGTAASLERTDADTIRIDFTTPVRAPAPGQSAVFYDDAGHVLGGGIITPDGMEQPHNRNIPVRIPLDGHLSQNGEN